MARCGRTQAHGDLNCSFPRRQGAGTDNLSCLGENQCVRAASFPNGSCEMLRDPRGGDLIEPAGS